MPMTLGLPALMAKATPKQTSFLTPSRMGANGKGGEIRQGGALGHGCWGRYG
jgi:hypothetical protein